MQPSTRLAKATCSTWSTASAPCAASESSPPTQPCATSPDCILATCSLRVTSATLTWPVGRQLHRALTIRRSSVGGATPSLLEPAQIPVLLDARRAHSTLLPSAEITVEANPGDLDTARVAAYLEAGVNRISLGIQTFDDG